MTSRQERRALAVDLDGVIVDGMPFHVAAWHVAFADVSNEIPDAWFYELEGIPTRDVVDCVLERLGEYLSPRHKTDIAAKKKESYRQLYRVVPLAYGPDLVKWAHDQGHGVAIVTGAPRRSAEQAVRELALERYVAAIIGVEDTASGKPTPAPYLAALARLQVAPQCCLAIENAPAGLISAINAGLPCAAVATYVAPTVLDKANVVREDVGSLISWLGGEAARSGGLGPWFPRSSEGGYAFGRRQES